MKEFTISELAEMIQNRIAPMITKVDETVYDIFLDGNKANEKMKELRKLCEELQPVVYMVKAQYPRLGNVVEMHGKGK